MPRTPANISTTRTPSRQNTMPIRIPATTHETSAASTVTSWRTRTFIIVAGSVRPAWTGGGLRRVRPGSAPANNPSSAGGLRRVRPGSAPANNPSSGGGLRQVRPGSAPADIPSSAGGLRQVRPGSAPADNPSSGGGLRRAGPGSAPADNPSGVASFRPPAGTALEEAREDVRADDQDQRHEHERDVVRGSQKTVRVVDESTHTGLRAEDLTDDDADHAQREPGPQSPHEREEHRGQHDPTEDGHRARAVRARDGDELRVHLANAGENRQRDRKEAQQEAECDLRGRVEAEEKHQGGVPDDRRHCVERRQHGSPDAADEPVHTEHEAAAESGRDRQRVRRPDLAQRQPEARRQLGVGAEQQEIAQCREDCRWWYGEERVRGVSRDLPDRQEGGEKTEAQPEDSHRIARSDSSRISLQSLARSAAISGDSIERGYSIDSSSVDLIRPGRAVMTATRVDRNSASCRLWVTKMTVLRVRRQMSRSHSPIRTRVCSSSAPNGSSIRRIFASIASARPIATRCFIPPDSSRGYFSAKPESPSGPSSSLAVRRRRAAGTPWSSRPNSTFSSAVRHGKRPASWNTVATRRGSGVVTGWPSTRRRPSSGATRPPSMPSSVDLPHPEGPMSVQKSPSPTESETSWSASTGPELVR